MCGSSNGASFCTPDGQPPIPDGIVYVHTPQGVELGTWHSDQTVTTATNTYHVTPDNS